LRRINADADAAIIPSREASCGGVGRRIVADAAARVPDESLFGLGCEICFPHYGLKVIDTKNRCLQVIELKNAECAAGLRLRGGRESLDQAQGYSDDEN